jgi:exodeoxyribonuclease VII small subunit
MRSKNIINNDDETLEAGQKRQMENEESLEKKDVTLDDALNGFEEGVKLSRKLSDKLSQAQARLETLTKGANGKLKATPMDGDNDGDDCDFEDEDEDEDEDEEGYDE